MSTIRVKCIDQTLVLTNTPVISSGGIQEDHVSFSFCPLWAGYYKTAVFWRTEADPYHVILDDTNSCEIPPEVLTSGGVLYFGVFGVNDAGAQRTSNVLRYNIELGTITEGTHPSDPTPDIYTQLLAAVASLGDNKGKADKVESATEGNLAGLDANGNLTDSGKKAADFVAASEKGKPNGVPTLDEDGKVPEEQLPELGCLASEEKGKPGGVATLNESGKVPEEQLDIPEFGEHVLWLVPYSYPDVTTFDTPDKTDRGEYSFQSIVFDLPKKVDPSKYVYEFVIVVYGILRYGDDTVATVCGEVELLREGASSAVKLTSLMTTKGLPSSGVFDHLTFPSKGCYVVEPMENGGQYTTITGSYRGEEIVGLQELITQNSDFGTAVYDRVRLKMQSGTSSYLEPVETFGVKFTYRATRKRG